MATLPIPIRSESAATGHLSEPARRVVLQGEDQSKFDQILAGLRSDYQPRTILEEHLCLQIAESFWRLQRTTQLETGLFNSGTDFLEIADTLDKLRRYRGSIEREWHKSIDQLVKLQELRSKANPEVPKERRQPKPPSKIDDLLKQYLFAPMPGRGTALDAEEALEENEIGFVLQNPESA